MNDIRRLAGYIGPYKKDMMLGALMVTIETAFELFIPIMIADLIDIWSLLLRREGQQLEVRWRRDRNLQCPDRGDQPLGGRLQLSEPVPWQHDLLLSTGGTRPDGYDPCILRERCVDRGTERFARRGRREPLYGCPSFTGGRLLLPLDGEDRPWCEGK